MHDDQDSHDEHVEDIAAAMAAQHAVLSAAFSEQQLEALERSGLYRLSDIPQAFGAAAVRDDLAEGQTRITWKQVLGDRSRDKEQGRRYRAEVSGLVEFLLEIRSEFRTVLTSATAEDAVRLRSMVEKAFARSDHWGETTGIRRGPADRVVGIAHAIEILEYLRFAFEYGGSETWENLSAARDVLLAEPLMEQRAAVVGVADDAIAQLRKQWGEVAKDEVLDGIIEHVFKTFTKSPHLVEFGNVERAYMRQLLGRATPDRRKALGAPYIAAAWSLQVGAFGDKAEPGEPEAEACRRISNIFRNAWNAARARRR